MTKFCDYTDRNGYCGNIVCPYYFEQCPIPIDQWCPMMCNNPEIEVDEEDEWYE